MDKYSNYFMSLNTFKAKKEILDDLENLFNEKISHYNYQKIICHFVENDVIKEISEKRKRFYISTMTVENKGTSLEDLFSAEKLGFETNKALSKVKSVSYDEYLDDDAIESAGKLTELFK